MPLLVVVVWFVCCVVVVVDSTSANVGCLFRIRATGKSSSLSSSLICGVALTGNTLLSNCSTRLLQVLLQSKKLAVCTSSGVGVVVVGAGSSLICM